ncbi:hypothetical protein [Mycolicibacterium sp. lyk4-40-TYG-92]|uniref:hypothetical protein n=1 Tax=Mycolicibacterium sp. lyk4-40-TYG-92 TaxID=3040295 RepID=UPI00254F2484|nr:hypothetical protein [Mycolicibacterium sp. lyk4-40-TYG-92]
MALAGVLVISGCGGTGSGPGGPVSKIPTIAIDYDAELRDAIMQQRAKLEDFDIDGGAALVCEKYRDAYRTKYEAQLPSMASVATREQAADPAYMAALPGVLKERYPNTYSDEIKAVVDAAGRQDPAAYRTAAMRLMGRVFQVKKQSVDNLVNSGGSQPHSATADVTTTTQWDGQPEQTVMVHKTFETQDGSAWLDCTDPAG